MEPSRSARDGEEGLREEDCEQEGDWYSLRKTAKQLSVEDEVAWDQGRSLLPEVKVGGLMRRQTRDVGKEKAGAWVA